MAELVYVLCALTSVGCAALLFRGYRRSGTKLLFWSGLCFIGLGLNNIFLVVDLVLVPVIDFSLVRSGFGLAAMIILLFGLVWEPR